MTGELKSPLKLMEKAEELSKRQQTLLQEQRAILNSRHGFFGIMSDFKRNRIEGIHEEITSITRMIKAIAWVLNSGTQEEL